MSVCVLSVVINKSASSWRQHCDNWIRVYVTGFFLAEGDLQRGMIEGTKGICISASIIMSISLLSHLQAAGAPVCLLD